MNSDREHFKNQDYRPHYKSPFDQQHKLGYDNEKT